MGLPRGLHRTRHRVDATVLEIARSQGLLPEKAKTPARVAAGVAAKLAGVKLETVIDQVLERADRQGEAAVERLHRPTAGDGAFEPGLVRVTGWAKVDYLGTWRPRETARALGAPFQEFHGLRGIAFDVKSQAGAASFGPPGASAGKGKDLKRFYAQVDYLRDRREAHGWATGFVVVDRELGAAYLVTDLDTLAKGQAIQLRSIQRATTRAPQAIRYLVPWLPIGDDLAVAGIPELGTGRPRLDLLRLFLEASSPE